jgi:hypothetical protein
VEQLMRTRDIAGLAVTELGFGSAAVGTPWSS